MITYNSITSIQAHNLLRPIFYEENTYSAHWAPSLATPLKADDQKKNETPFRTNKLNMSELFGRTEFRIPRKIKTLSYQGRGIWGHHPGVVIEIPSNGLQYMLWNLVALPRGAETCPAQCNNLANENPAGEFGVTIQEW